MAIQLRPIVIPDFGVPVERPRVPAATYEARCGAAYRKAACDWLVVYADREHCANMAHLTGFEPRFEEALLLLGPADTRVLVVGNESLSYAPLAGLPGLTVLLSQSLSLMGQDRTLQPRLEAVLRDAGLGRGQSIGVVGWKYFEPEEWDGDEPAMFVPDFLKAALWRVAGDGAAISDRTAVLMHPGHGLRAIVDADQIAAFEWGAARASVALWRILSRVAVGETELEAAGRMGYAGEPLTCHMMLASNDQSGPVVGLRSPTARRLQRGDGVTAAIGYWGGLSSRAGLLVEQDDAFLATASSYFEGLVAWYGAADIGVAGGDVFEAVSETLAQGGLHAALSPGHLTSYDEWSHSPMRPGSKDRIASGMPFQVDVIPVPMPDGWTLNCEDAVTFADKPLRRELAERHPAVFARIEARRAFVRDQIGVDLKPSILPMSSTPLCLPPFWLSPGRLLARA